MFDIVVCSKSLGLMNRSIKAINKALMGYEFDYHIDRFMGDSFKNIGNRKIYIIDADNYLDIVYNIRKRDFVSIIILVNSHDKIDMNVFHNNLLIFDYVCLDNQYDRNIIDDINIGLKILFMDNVFSFHYNHVMYRIPYESINYIEKEPNVKRCIIHASDREYYIVDSIQGIIGNLNGMFIRSNQSCIINVMNVKYIDCINNVVYFNNGDMTNLMTNKVKRVINDKIR